MAGRQARLLGVFAEQPNECLAALLNFVIDRAALMLARAAASPVHLLVYCTRSRSGAELLKRLVYHWLPVRYGVATLHEHLT